PGVLEKQVSRLHIHESRGIPQCNAGSAYIPGQKVRQSQDVVVVGSRAPRFAGGDCENAGACIVCGEPGPLSSVEGKAAKRVTVIELFQLCPAELATEPVLM